MRPQFEPSFADLRLSRMTEEAVERFRKERDMKFRVNWVMWSTLWLQAYIYISKTLVCKHRYKFNKYMNRLTPPPIYPLVYFWPEIRTPFEVQRSASYWHRPPKFSVSVFSVQTLQHPPPKYVRMLGFQTRPCPAASTFRSSQLNGINISPLHFTSETRK